MRRATISIPGMTPSNNAPQPMPQAQQPPRPMRQQAFAKRYAGAYRANIESVIAAIQNELDNQQPKGVNILLREWNQIPNGQALSLVYQRGNVVTAMYLVLTAGDPLLPITIYDKVIADNVTPEEIPAILAYTGGLNGYAPPKEFKPAEIPEVMQ